MRILILSLFGAGTALSPTAYYERLEACKTRAQTLMAQEGFVEMCFAHALIRGIKIFLHAQGHGIAAVCKYRAVSDVFNGGERIPGTICEDTLVTADIPADCRYVMVAYTTTKASAVALSATLDGMFVSQALSRLVAVHASGFAVSIEPELETFGNDAILRLDPLKLKPLVLPSGQLAPGSMRLLKSDLEKFQDGISERFNDEALIRDFGNWVRKFRIDRAEIPTPTEYAEWITRFAESSIKKRKVSEVSSRKSLAKTPTLREFLTLFSSCKNELPRARSDDEIEIDDEFTLVSSHEALRIVERTPGGENGEIFITSKPDMLIKRALSRSDFCLELAALTALKGLGGRVPELYEVENPIGRMMVMQRVGETDWPLNTNPQRPSNEHLAQVIEIVRDLHEAGFVHRDIHEANIRMDDRGVYLIDFGMVRPLFISGGNPLETRRTDMMLLAQFVITPSAPRGLELLADMDSLFDNERPDYEKWIAHFRSLL